MQLIPRKLYSDRRQQWRQELVEANQASISICITTFCGHELNDWCWKVSPIGAGLGAKWPVRGEKVQCNASRARLFDGDDDKRQNEKSQKLVEKQNNETIDSLWCAGYKFNRVASSYRTIRRRLQDLYTGQWTDKHDEEFSFLFTMKEHWNKSRRISSVVER